MAKKVYNRVKELIAEKERRTGESISTRDIADATGLSKNTVVIPLGSIRFQGPWIYHYPGSLVDRHDTKLMIQV